MNTQFWTAVVFLIGVFGVTAWILYRLSHNSKTYRKNRVLKWLPEEEQDLKAFLQQINAADTEEALQEITGAATRRFPQHHGILAAAQRERLVALPCNTTRSFEEEEASVRTLWRIQLIVVTCAQVILLFMSCFMNRWGEFELDGLFLISTVGIAVMQGIQYYCSFMKKGTKFLTYSLVSTTLVGLPRLLVNIPLLGGTFVIAQLACWVFFVVTSYRLLRINKMIQTREQLHYLTA